MQKEIDEYVNTLTRSFKEKIEEVLSTLDQHLERKLLIFLLNKIRQYDFIQPGYLQFDYEYEKATSRSSEYQYPHKSDASNYRFSSFIIKAEKPVPVDETYFRDYISITPKYIEPINKDEPFESGKCYVLDIAIIIKRKYDDGQIEIIKKVCIICNRNDSYTSRKQLQTDFDAMNKLMQLGWILLMFSEQELENIGLFNNDSVSSKIEKILLDDYLPSKE